MSALVDIPVGSSTGHWPSPGHAFLESSGKLSVTLKTVLNQKTAKMPLWRIFYPSNVWSESDKKSLSDAITKIYTNVGLPAFYVVVIFTSTTPSDGIYVGGVKTDKFVRISIDQIARDSTRNPIEKQKAWLNGIDAAIAPFIKDRGLDWEVHIDSTPRSLWRIQGIDPPEGGSAGEKLWVEKNSPVPLD